MAQGEERKDWRKVRQMTMVRPDTPLTDVLKLLLDAGVSAVPVVDDKVRRCSAGPPHHRIVSVVFAHQVSARSPTCSGAAMDRTVAPTCTGQQESPSQCRLLR